MMKIATAEFLGTLLLLAAVVGSGIMGENLSGGSVGLALLANSLATGGALYALISLFGPVSGAHFNPAVTLALAGENKPGLSDTVVRILAQVAGALCGVLLAHLMFDLPLLQVSEKLRWSTGQWASECVATFGLVLLILGLLRHQAKAVPAAVSLYIVAAYWFTASTSFANPAVTLARSLTNTFAGIAPACVLPFMLSQLIGMGLAVLVSRALFGERQA